ncbi:hypothetical protein KRX52_02650 [Pseudomonas sp. MAP12]|uniref:Lipoprotein n=1 Tax=Geopseudomonas aromaticivorans TaxID=2849492 RepID=A0ABS6MSC0_9GAMM|nr:hypothetical protein [Pseudomonas aromaticivorans]MBV2131694.1 hypothetical protein [Pseudomonas aromaticivorans]
MSVIRNLPLLVGIALLGACASQSDNQQLTSTVSQSAVVAQGVPGGILIEEEQVRATVVALDRSKRTFTLQDEQGNRRTVQAPPEMRNYPQLAVGDQLTATVRVESSLYLREPGKADEESREGAAMVLTPPQGSKPGLLVASTQTATAVVKAIDTRAHTATLQFADGSSRTYQVRPDVEVKPEYLNREVVIRQDSEVSVSVETP